MPPRATPAPSQRRGLMVLLGILIAILAIRLILNPTTIGEFKPGQSPASDELADRMDPNTASQAELAAIPELGEKRAAAIIHFRDQFESRHPNERAFERLSDLEKVSGIGAAMVETMKPYLDFPTSSTRE